MIVLVAPFLMHKNIQGVAIFPFLFVRSKNVTKQPIVMNHEKIHFRQQLELGWIGFFIWYLLEFLVGYLIFRNWIKAYQNISFEREAYANEREPDYLKYRKVWSFWKYLKG